jgi:WxL domain surface cell wall-binding
MRHNTTTRSRWRSWRVGTIALIFASVGTSVAVTGEPAEAASCSTATPAGTTCTMTGTMTLGAGTLTLTGASSGSLTWGTTLSGLDQTTVDTAATDQTYTVDDATGSGAGWHVTVSATTFTTGGGTPTTLNDTGTLSTNGSITSATDTTAPSSACTSGATCTLPTNTTTYPVAITTAATSPTAYTVFDDSASTGVGSIVVGGPGPAVPVGWWLSIPATTKPGTFTSTVTMEVISTP